MIKKIFSSQLRINMASGVAATVINTASLAVMYPICLSFMGYEKYGVWLVLSTVLTFAQLGNLGIGPAVVKLIAEEHSRNDKEAIEHYTATALALLCISGTVVLMVIMLFREQIIALFRLSSDNAGTVLWLLPYIGMLSIYVFVIQVLNSVLSGLGRMDLANYIQSAGRVVLVTVSGAMLYNGGEIESLLVGNVFSNIFMHIASLICIRRILDLRFLKMANFDMQRGKRILRFGGAVFGGSLINMLLSPFNKMMLSRYAGVAAMPVYEIAYNGSVQVRALAEVGLRALMPEISRIGGQLSADAGQRIQQLYRRQTKLIFIFGGVVYGLIILLLPGLLKLWLGAKLVASLPGTFRIMLIGTFLSLLCVPAYYTLMGLGRVRPCFLSYLIQAAVNVAVIGIVLLVTGTLSVEMVAWAIVLAMGATSYYLVRQYRNMVQTLPT
ncbi:MAG: oligosaccharide flippase family protein [Thermodesulfobacteriota bacterium]